MTIISETTPTARITHVCDECDDGIAAGQKYHRAFCINDGDVYVFKLCGHCVKASAWFCSVMDDPHEGYDVGSLWECVWEYLDGDPLPSELVMPESIRNRRVKG
jgi:hypothetical protein